MSWILSALLAVQVISALSIIVLVLLQQGKGADMGSAFGAGGSGGAGSLFGSAGAANFLSRATKWAAVVFFATTVGLAYMSHARGPAPAPSGVMEGYQDPSVPQLPGSGDAGVPAAPDASVPTAPASPDAAVPAPAPAPA
ncbi:preprotein translocase subunit SecG, partial [Achromobacter sp. GG226]|uniref:preprotein translocase subunit SecG n=1 Tax=Verticiella alkaliphila TaxID=2779529 RepID=UPI001C0BCBE9